MLWPGSSCNFLVLVVINFGQKSSSNTSNLQLKAGKNIMFFFSYCGVFKKQSYMRFLKNAKIYWRITNKLHYIFLFIKIEDMVWFYNHFIEL